MQADHLFNGVYIGSNISEPPFDMPAVNCCWTAERLGEINVPFSDDDYIDTRTMNAFREAISTRVDSPNILIRCQMGLNRSALIAGGILIAEGYRPQNVVDRIREVRGSQALSNTYFEKVLLSGGFPIQPMEPIAYAGSIMDEWGPAIVISQTVNGRLRIVTDPQGEWQEDFTRLLEGVRVSSIRRGWIVPFWPNERDRKPRDYEALIRARLVSENAKTAIIDKFESFDPEQATTV